MTRLLRALSAALIAALLGLTPALAQNNWPTPGGSQADGAVEMILNGSNQAVPVSASNPVPVSGSFSASLSGFAPTSQGTPISVTTGGVTGSLPSGTVVVATNVGATNAAYCALGASATTSSQYIAPGGGWFAFTVGAATQLTCITSTGTTTVNTVGGSGLATGAGGAVAAASVTANAGTNLNTSALALETGGNLATIAGAVSANKVAISVADGSDVTLGAKADSAWSSGSGSVIALLKNLAASLSTIATNTGAAIPAGSNLIGYFGGDGTAGTASTHVLTIQGIASMTAVKVDNSAVTQPVQGQANVTPTDCSGTITSGATAQNAFTAQTTLHGFTIVNIDTSAAEVMWISFTTTAAANTAQSYMLNPASATAAGGSFSSPLGFGLNHALSVIAATTGHKFSCTWW